MPTPDELYTRLYEAARDYFLSFHAASRLAQKTVEQTYGAARQAATDGHLSQARIDGAMTAAYTASRHF
jgi:hypothetical protein